MTREEAIAVVAKAIRSGIFNDLGSGSNVDLCAISEGGKKVDYLRNYEKLQGKTYTRQEPVVFPKGTARAPLNSHALCSALCVRKECADSVVESMPATHFDPASCAGAVHVAHHACTKLFAQRGT